MTTPQRPQLVAQAARNAADFDLARRIAAQAEEHDGSSPVSDQAFVAATQGQRSLLLFSAPELDPVAVGIIGQGEVDLVVHPSARGRGVGSTALADLLARDPAELLAWAHGENPAAEALLTAASFTPVRTLYRMELDPALLPGDGTDPLTLPVPQGLSLRAFDPVRREDAAAWVEANAAAFFSHPEQGRITEADFALMRQEPWFDQADLILLEETSAAGSPTRLAGSTWLKASRELGPAGTSRVVESELYALGVRPERAGEGLGRLLLDVTLARMAEHAPERVSLYVDGENERAVALYSHAGFTIGSQSRQWARRSVSVANARIEP